MIRNFFHFDPLRPPLANRTKNEKKINVCNNNTKDSLTAPLLRRLSSLSGYSEIYGEPDGLDSSSRSTDQEEESSRHDFTSETRFHFGQPIEWKKNQESKLSSYIEPEDLEPYRFVGDPEVDALMDMCNAEGIPGAGRFDDFLDFLVESSRVVKNATNEDKSPSQPSPARREGAKFYHKYYEEIPEWVDWSAIQRGADVFITYLPAAAICLFYKSLVPGFGLPNIVAVLEETRYLAPPASPTKVAERLIDTGGFVNTCVLPSEKGISADSLRPGNAGWDAALRVRALHAKVRRSILRKSSGRNSAATVEGKMKGSKREAEHKENRWNLKKFGVPINQEDMAGTLLAFSIIVLNSIEFLSGHPLTREEQLDYLALWRYVGWLLGIPVTEKLTQHCRYINNDTETIVEKESVSNYSQNLLPLDPCGCRPGGDSNDPIIHSYDTLMSILYHQQTPDDSSIRVVHHLLVIGRQKNFDTLVSGSQKNFDTKEKIKNDVSQGDYRTSFSFLYRGFVCRKFVGDLLGDALQLPKVLPQSSCSSLFYYMKINLAFFFSLLMLIFIRSYTLLTIKSAMFRRLVYVRHIRLLRSFQSMWLEKHEERMGKAEKDYNKTKGQNDSKCSKTSKKEKDGLELLENNKNTSSCPFALVMPPKT